MWPMKKTVLREYGQKYVSAFIRIIYSKITTAGQLTDQNKNMKRENRNKSEKTYLWSSINLHNGREQN